MERDFEDILNSEREVCVPTFEQDIERRTTARTGMGLFAKKDIPAGSVVFAEKVLCLTYDVGPEESEADVDKGIHKSAKEMGEEWYSKFLDLASALDKFEKHLALQVWAKNYLPARSDDKEAGILGLNLARMNHSCRPNCTMTLPKKYPNQNSEEDPVVTCAVMLATSDIKEGQELTFSYFDVTGSVPARKEVCLGLGHFICACRVCHKPDDAVEASFRALQEVDSLMLSPSIIERRPALAYYGAYWVSNEDFMGRHNNVMVAHILAQCAVVAGFHSDVARAICFLDEAVKRVSPLRPVEDPFRRLFTYWRNNLGEMPGYGSSTAGLSTEGQKLDFQQDKSILFMLHAQSREYMRVGHCRHFTDAMRAQIEQEIKPCDILYIPQDFDETREDNDWNQIAERHLRCDTKFRQKKRKQLRKRVYKILERLEKQNTQTEHTARPDSPSMDVEMAFDEVIKKMAGLMEDHVCQPEPAEGESATGGEESDTGSSATVVPAQAIKKAKKNKKGRK